MSEANPNTEAHPNTGAKPNILAIDDTPENLLTLQLTARRAGVDQNPASRRNTAAVDWASSASGAAGSPNITR